MKGSDAIVKELLENKTNSAFVYPGTAIVPLLESMENTEGFRCITVRHEQCAAHAADGYARATGKAGIAVATTGPGATNLVTGIATAFMDSSPIVAIGGQVEKKLLTSDAFQEVDMMSVTMAITKYNFLIRNSNEIMPTIKAAFKIASSGRQGPVYIDLSKDAQINEVTKEIKKNYRLKKVEPDFMKIKKATEMLFNAERPLILTGGGLHPGKCIS